MKTNVAVFILLTGLFSIAIADEPIRHSFFIAGPSFTGIIDEDGKEIPCTLCLGKGYINISYM